jgi:hypothetical protein
MGMYQLQENRRLGPSAGKEICGDAGGWSSGDFRKPSRIEMVHGGVEQVFFCECVASCIHEACYVVHRVY